jgi:hypothetical protein
MAALGVTFREYRPEDRESAKALAEKHAKKAGLIFWADPEYPNHVLTVVAENSDGVIVGYGTGRITAELFLTVDPDAGTPPERWELIKTLLGHAKALAKNAGLDELFLNVPQGLKRYAERLKTVPDVYFDDRFHLILAARVRETEEAANGCRR